MKVFAVYVRRWDKVRQGWGRRLFLGHITTWGRGESRTMLEHATRRVRAEFAQIIGPADRVDLVVESSGSRHFQAWSTTPAAAGTGLL